MAIKFKAQAKRNPQDITLPEKYYASAIADGEVDLDVLSEQIAYECTVTESDCYAVLLSLERNIIRSLDQGRIVKLGRLGNFQVSVSSEGRDTPEEVNAGLITKARVLFRPGRRLRSLLTDLTYKKAS
ncbi:HU family DNA-binding protein [Olleya aquimaris]|uniref:Putative histone-like DNA-binding protein n=1 Tax=Olleya aquimaris TaxID=639310 RepID=A0A327RH72_9FLAO|nr:HU family DNA-binding protein [Olleya aquimaris]RAJ16376.1 putative histone-like DNA-binding protein [Olleya aquimaris]